MGKDRGLEVMLSAANPNPLAAMGLLIVLTVRGNEKDYRPKHVSN